MARPPAPTMPAKGGGGGRRHGRDRDRVEQAVTGVQRGKVSRERKETARQTVGVAGRGHRACEEVRGEQGARAGRGPREQQHGGKGRRGEAHEGRREKAAGSGSAGVEETVDGAAPAWSTAAGTTRFGGVGGGFGRR